MLQGSYRVVAVLSQCCHSVVTGLSQCCHRVVTEVLDVLLT
jgi:hypothetical protein